MDASPRCELHEAAIVVGPHESEVLLRLTRSPIGAECQRCSVCRWARTYIERRLAERAGRVLPPGETGEAALRELQVALAAVRPTVHRTG